MIWREIRRITGSFPLVLAFLAAFPAGAGEKALTIAVLGDSIAEGYGVPKESAFPEQVERLLHDEAHHPEARVINAGIGGSTSASGLSRLRWLLRRKPDILILELGANDALRGIKPEDTRRNLGEIVEVARRNGIRVLLAGMMAPPNYGAEYSTRFRRIFQEIARRQHVALLPFLLDRVAGVPALNQEDGIHPNRKGQEIVARNVLKYLKPLL